MLCSKSKLYTKCFSILLPTTEPVICIQTIRTLLWCDSWAFKPELMIYNLCVCCLCNCHSGHWLKFRSPTAPNPKDIQFRIILSRQKQQIFTFEKLKPRQFWTFCLMNDLTSFWWFIFCQLTNRFSTRFTNGLGSIQILYLKALHTHGKPTQAFLIILAD